MQNDEEITRKVLDEILREAVTQWPAGRKNGEA